MNRDAMLQMTNIVKLLRWVGVLPAAMLGAYLTQVACFRLAGGLLFSAPHPFWSGIRSLTHGVVSALSVAAFIGSGVAMAPQARRPTAWGLAGITLLAVLATHLLSQRQPGHSNWLDIVAVNVGGMLAIAAVITVERTMKTRVNPEVHRQE